MNSRGGQVHRLRSIRDSIQLVFAVKYCTDKKSDDAHGEKSVAAVAASGALLPQSTFKRLGHISGDKPWPGKE